MSTSLKNLFSISSIVFSLLIFNPGAAFAASTSILNTDEDTSTEIVDIYTGDTLQFTVEEAEEGSFVRIGKYTSTDLSEIVEMDALPTTNEEGIYELELSVTNEGLELTDFTPGNYAIGVGTEDSMSVTAQFNVLSRFTDVQIDIGDEDDLFVDQNLVFTSTYKLKDNGDFETDPETAPFYETYLSIHELNSDGVSPGSAIIDKMQEGDFDDYSLSNGTYTVPLDEKFEAGKYFIVAYKVIHDTSPAEITGQSTVEAILKKQFTVHDIVSVNLSPDNVENPELGQSFDVQTSFEITDGTSTEIVSTLPDGLKTLKVYINGNGLTPLTPAEGQTFITDNGDGNYTVYINEDLYEISTQYTLGLQDDTDELSRADDAIEFVVAGHMLTGLTEDLSANLVPGFESIIDAYNLAAASDEEFITFTLEMVEGVTFSMSSDKDDDPVITDNTVKFGLADGTNTITLTLAISELAGDRDRTYTISVEKEAVIPEDNDTPSGGGGSGGGGASSGGLGGGGVVSNTDDNTSVVTLSDESNEPNENECKLHELDQDINFSEINGHWAELIVKSLLSGNLIGPEIVGVFAPNEPISRADAVKMIFCLGGNTYETGLTGFSDSSDHAMADLIATAKNLGLITGYEDGSFNPGAPISRAELLVMIFNSKGINAQASGGDYFADVVKGSWYENAVNFAFEKAIVSGMGDGLFAPHNQVTKAEAAKMIYLSNQNL